MKERLAIYAGHMEAARHQRALEMGGESALARSFSQLRPHASVNAALHAQLQAHPAFEGVVSLVHIDMLGDPLPVVPLPQRTDVKHNRTSNGTQRRRRRRRSANHSKTPVAFIFNPSVLDE